FGKLAELQVDDQMLAGLLYLPDLTVNGQKRRVLFASTVNNTIYAFDADKLGPPLWERNFNKDFNASGRPSSQSEVNFNGNVNFSGNVGIVGTPVIATSTNTMYLVTRTEEDASVVQRLWAIDVTNGNNRVRPVIISAGEFSSDRNNQRSALAYGNETVYIAWASYGDAAPYHGMVKAYDSKILLSVGEFNVTPSGEMGGIWMAGGAPSMDTEGNLYYATGNGTWNGETDFGVSIVKLRARTLEVLDWFTPYDWQNLNNNDLDLGSSYPVILPGLNMLIIGGKAGKMYLLNTDNLGRIAEQDSQIPQSWDTSSVMHHGIAAWRGPNGLTLYTWNGNEYLRAYRYDSSSRKFILPSVAQGAVIANGFPATGLTISSNSDKPGTGVVWATVPMGNALTLSVPGRLFAFSAEEADGELPLLWTSEAPEDDMHYYAKGSPPLVLNGRVYVPSASNVISVYGLK
ncbi:MAG: hypothetical protein J2P21_31175, partial [Chloracidobacterium sp.]|nr:hypothetical protein [Chloracidobacterium sp.]